MQATRRYVHTILAALLCMCLLVSYMPLPASAAEAPRPSVSDEVGQALPTGDEQAQLGTTVNVLAVASPAIVEHTESFAASVAQISGNSSFDLKVVATGKGELAYSWTRTADGQPDDSFAFDGGSVYPLSEHADTLQDGTVYVYTVVVRDETGSTATASIQVVAKAGYEYRTIDSAEAEGVSASAWMHVGALLHAAAVDPAQPLFGMLQAAAGAPLASAYHLDLGAEGETAYVGEVQVALPAPGVPDGDAAMVGIGADGSAMTLSAQVEGGIARFSTEVLGAFAVVADEAEAAVHAVEASAGEGGQILPAGTVKVAEGASVTFTALPDAGFALDAMLVDGAPVDAPGGVCTIADVRGDRTVKALFRAVEPDPARQHAVSAVVAGGNGAVSVNNGAAGASAQAQVAHGERAVVALFPDEGWTVDAVTADDGSGAVAVPALNGTCTIAAAESDVSVRVTFARGVAPPVPVFTVTATATGGGSITPAEARVPLGGSAEFKVEADEGCVLKSLTVDGADAMGRLSGTVLSVQNVVSDRAVEAVFEREAVAETHTVTAAAGEGGSISPSGAVEVPDGGARTFYLYPDEGFRLASVVLERAGRTADVTGDVVGGVYVLADVREDCALAASFEPSGVVVPDDTYYTVTATAGEGGIVSPAGDVRVKAGGSATFGFVPDEGHALETVTVNGEPMEVRGSSLTLSGVAANASVHATFRALGSGEPKPEQPVLHEIRAEAGPGGVVSPAGAVQVPEGGSMPFSFVPLAGYALDRVLVDGQPVDAAEVADGAYRFDDVREPHSLRAEFEPASGDAPRIDPVIIATAGEHGSISPADAVSVAYDGSQTFSFVPEAGYKVASVTVDDQPVPEDELTAGAYTLFNVRQDAAVHVEFAADAGAVPPTVHTVHASATAGGFVSPAGDVAVVEGQSLTLRFGALAGYELYRVTVDDADVPEAVAAGFYRFDSVTSEASVRAFFKRAGADPVDPEDPDKPTGYAVIQASASDGGSIEPSGNVEVGLGASKRFTFQPNDGYELDQVLVDGAAVDPAKVADGSYTFENVRTGATIHAAFKKGAEPPARFHAVTASASSGGSVAPSGRTDVKEGESATFEFRPDAGYKLVRVLLDGAPVDAAEIADGRYTVSDVRADHAVRGEFAPEDAPEPAYAVVHVSAGAGGSASPTGDVRVVRGGSCSVLLLPADGYALDAVQVNGRDATRQVEDFRLVLPAVTGETWVEATFRALDQGEPQPDVPEVHEVTASSTSGGTISPRGRVLVAHGDGATFAVTANEGYRLASVLVDGVELGAAQVEEAARTGVLALAAVEGDRSVRAVFERIPDGPAPEEPPTVNVDVEVKVSVTSVRGSEGGTVQPESLTVPRGARDIAFYIYPEEGYVPQSVAVNGEPAEFHPVEAAAPASVFGFRAAVFSAAGGQAGAYWFAIAEAQEDAVVDVVFRERTADDPKPAPVTTYRVETEASAGGTITPSMTVPEGRDAQLAVVPDAGFKLASLTVEENGATRDALGEVADGMLVLSAVSADAKVTAAFAPDVEPPRYATLHVAAGDHGSVSPDGDVRVLRGADQLFAVVPDDGYAVDQVTVGGVPVAVDGFSFTVPNVQNDAEVVVSFREAAPTDPPKPAFHTVTPSATTGGAVHPADPVKVAHGGSASFSLLPDEGYELANVTLDGADLPAYRWRDGALRLDDVQADHEVRAEFRKTVPPAPGQVRVTTEAGEGGRIDPAGPLDVDEGTNLIFSFVPEDGFELDAVKVNGVVVPVAGNQYELMGVSVDTVVSATFKASSAPPVETHVVTASVAGGKGGEIVPKGPVEVPHDGAQLFTFKPAEGYELDAVLADGERVEPVRPEGALPYYLMKNVTADRSIVAVFRAEGGDEPIAPTEFTLTAGVAGGHGSIRPSGEVKVSAGGTRTFQFEADPGYRVRALIIDGVRSSFDGTSYPFVDVQADHSILVEFGLAAPAAPNGPIDAAGRGAQTALGYVKTGDATGPIACAAAVLALVAAGVAAASRRRAAKAGRP